MKLGITRIRNEAQIIRFTLDRLSDHLDGIVVFDDCSDDGTFDICMNHPLVIHIHQNKVWSPEPEIRKALETSQRQYLHDLSFHKYKPEWMLYFDGDEHLYFDDIDWNADVTYWFRLFHVYITESDKQSSQNFLTRQFIGSEYLDIPMLFKPPARFYNRLVQTRYPRAYGGTVKHFGKGISVKHWEETCDYYINHLNETMANGETIAEKWERRKGKAVHELSDWGRPLITWDQRFDHPDLVNELDLYKQGVKPL